MYTFLLTKQENEIKMGREVSDWSMSKEWNVGKFRGAWIQAEDMEMACNMTKEIMKRRKEPTGFEDDDGLYRFYYMWFSSSLKESLAMIWIFFLSSVLRGL